jgi:hypothetical protein
VLRFGIVPAQSGLVIFAGLRAVVLILHVITAALRPLALTVAVARGAASSELPTENPRREFWFQKTCLWVA